jgi:hypothetical protein
MQTYFRLPLNKTMAIPKPSRFRTTSVAAPQFMHLSGASGIPFRSNTTTTLRGAPPASHVEQAFGLPCCFFSSLLEILACK